MTRSRAARLGSMQTLGLGAVSVALLAVFLGRQARVANPLMPLRLFRSRNVTGANVVMALEVVGMFGMFFPGARAGMTVALRLSGRGPAKLRIGGSRRHDETIGLRQAPPLGFVSQRHRVDCRLRARGVAHRAGRGGLRAAPPHRCGPRSATTY